MVLRRPEYEPAFDEGDANRFALKSEKLLQFRSAALLEALGEFVAVEADEDSGEGFGVSLFDRRPAIHAGQHPATLLHRRTKDTSQCWHVA